MKKISQQLVAARMAANRERAKQEGFYDGRFRPRTHKDRKRELDRRFCRGPHRTEE